MVGRIMASKDVHILISTSVNVSPHPARVKVTDGIKVARQLTLK
jgi:hypothetical protein